MIPWKYHMVGTSDMKDHGGQCNPLRILVVHSHSAGTPIPLTYGVGSVLCMTSLMILQHFLALTACTIRVTRWHRMPFFQVSVLGKNQVVANLVPALHDATCSINVVIVLSFSLLRPNITGGELKTEANREHENNRTKFYRSGVVHKWECFY